jgi:signal transduction histidine kinase
MSSTPRLFLISTDEHQRAAIRRALDELSERVELEELPSAEDAIARLGEATAVCVLLDHSPPELDGLEALARLGHASVDVPVIMLTSLADGELLSESLRRGADDFLLKDPLDAAPLAAKLAVAQRLHAARERARAAEAELHDTIESLRRAVAARDSVLAVVSHDLRGPLNNIELAMGLLEEKVPEQQRLLALASVHRAIARADRLISDLLDVARLSGGAIELVTEPVDPAAVVENALADVRPALQQHGQTTLVEIADDLGPILADRNRVIQILDNLLRNAIKYGPRGGQVTVSVRRRDGAVEFSVRDQGPGLDAATQAHVFDRFWRAREHNVSAGSGLGLAIAKGLVDSHGGEIGVESTPGSGARFYFTIPTVGPTVGPTI